MAVIKSADGGRNEKDEETDIEELDTDTLSTASVHNREFVSVEKKNVFYKKLIKSRLSQEASLHEAYKVKFDQSQMLKEIIDGQHAIFHRSVLERKAQRSDPYESVEDQPLEDQIQHHKNSADMLLRDINFVEEAVSDTSSFTQHQMHCLQLTRNLRFKCAKSVPPPAKHKGVVPRSRRHVETSAE